MRKIWVIAAREYRAAVRSKYFLITLLLMPVLMLATVGLQIASKRLDDTKEKKIAIVDRSPGGRIASALKADEAFFNQFLTTDPATGTRVNPSIEIEVVPASASDADAMLQQRYELSQRLERDDLFAVIEIGADVYTVRSNADPAKAADAESVRWQAKRPGEGPLGRWLDRRLNEAVQRERLVRENYDPEKVRLLQQLVPLKTKGLTKKDSTGKIEDAADEKGLANFFLPAILIALMFMNVMVGATPAMQGIVEEKGQRIAEVLLGSVRPFELMAGKLLGLAGVSLTMATVYLVGGYFVAAKYGMTDMLTPSLIVWFAIFQVLCLLIYGALFIAVGAAAADIKDTQTLLTPLMLVACLPFLALGPILLDPNGKIAVAASFFPFSAPMILVARESVPPGVPAWQMILGISITLATTVACVWGAGRIFRIGILMQGKGAKLKDLARWVFRG